MAKRVKTVEYDPGFGWIARHWLYSAASGLQIACGWHRTLVVVQDIFFFFWPLPKIVYIRVSLASNRNSYKKAIRVKSDRFFVFRL